MMLNASLFRHYAADITPCHYAPVMIMLLRATRYTPAPLAALRQICFAHFRCYACHADASCHAPPTLIRYAIYADIAAVYAADAAISLRHDVDILPLRYSSPFRHAGRSFRCSPRRRCLMLIAATMLIRQLLLMAAIYFLYASC